MKHSKQDIQRIPKVFPRKMNINTSPARVCMSCTNPPLPHRHTHLAVLWICNWNWRLFIFARQILKSRCFCARGGWLLAGSLLPVHAATFSISQEEPALPEPRRPLRSLLQASDAQQHLLNRKPPLDVGSAMGAGEGEREQLMVAGIAGAKGQCVTTTAQPGNEF